MSDMATISDPAGADEQMVEALATITYEAGLATGSSRNSAAWFSSVSR